MILEKLSNKVNPKKNIYRPTWKLETERSPDKIGSMGAGCIEGREEGEEEGRKGGLRRN